MNRRICFAAAGFHLLALAISTYIAAHEIKSILTTGVICSVTGGISGIFANRCQRPLLALASFLTPALAATLFVLEACFLHLGPHAAAFPFCILFIVNQIVATVTILVELNLLIAPTRQSARQITIRTLMVATLSFSVFFAAAKYLLLIKHNVLMMVALGLLGLTIVGLCVVLYTALSQRKAVRLAATVSPPAASILPPATDADAG